jgi:putative lipoprotein
MADAPKTEVVTGEIVLGKDALPAKAAKVVVQVEDVSRADAPSIVVGEQRLSNVALRGRGAIPFKVEIPAGLIDERGMYSVRAHVDVSGSGEVKEGDFVTTQSYPVLTRGYGKAVKLALRRV